MCLTTIDYSMKDRLKVDKDGYVQLWKVVRLDDRASLYVDHLFEAGMNEAYTEGCLWSNKDGPYYCGFHCFITRRAARMWRDEDCSYDEKIIKVYAKPEWITDCGEQKLSIRETPGRLIRYVGVAVCKKLLIKSLKHCR